MTRRVTPSGGEVAAMTCSQLEFMMEPRKTRSNLTTSKRQAEYFTSRYDSEKNRGLKKLSQPKYGHPVIRW